MKRLALVLSALGAVCLGFVASGPAGAYAPFEDEGIEVTPSSVLPDDAPINFDVLVSNCYPNEFVEITVFGDPFGDAGYFQQQIAQCSDDTFVAMATFLSPSDIGVYPVEAVLEPTDFGNPDIPDRPDQLVLEGTFVVGDEVILGGGDFALDDAIFASNVGTGGSSGPNIFSNSFVRSFLGLLILLLGLLLVFLLRRRSEEEEETHRVVGRRMPPPDPGLPSMA